MLLTIPPDKEYFSIGEVSRLSGVKPHVLRYWERAFGLVRPARRGTGHRRFGRRDVETIERIRELVEDRRLTLEGAKKELRAQNRRGAEQIPLAFKETSAAVEVLKELKRDMAELLNELKRPLSTDSKS
jgi:DNA-binding transcriptional MerR regulator